MMRAPTPADATRPNIAQDPRYAARERLARDVKTLNNIGRVEIVFRAWNLWRAGRRTTRCILTGTIPELSA